METLKRSAQLDVQAVEDFVRAQGKTVEDLLLWHDEVMTTNEDGMLAIIQAEQTRAGVVWIVTDLLDTGWMIENSFLPDGTIKRQKTR